MGEGAQAQNDVVRLEAEITQYRQTHSDLLQSYEQIRVAEAQATSNVVQVEPAIAPENPIRPRVLMNTALAAVVGGMLAVGAIFLVEALDDTLKNPDDVARQLGLPILGTILKHDVENGNPVTAEEPRSPTSEAYRSLRTNIKYASVDFPIRSLLVTSPSASEGKSTIASNLGVVLAQGGNRSILIDADMRRPTLHQKLKVPNRVGLSAFFVFQSLFKDAEDHPEGAIQDTITDGLSVITSGKIPPNPSELLASEKMVNIIEGLKEDAEIVIVDSPPVTAVTDSSVLAPRMDGVLLVVQPGITKLDAAKHAVEQLKRVNANVLGVVLNNVEPKSSRYGYYYRYDRAYYSEEDSEILRAAKTQRRLRWAIGGVVTAIVLGIGGWYSLSSSGTLPTWLGGAGSPTPSPTAKPVAMATTEIPAVAALGSTPTPTLASEQDAAPQVTDQTDQADQADQGEAADETQPPTSTPTISPTSPPPTPGPGISQPFGELGQFLLHQVVFGDNLPNLSSQYQTDRDVIVAANGLQPNQSLQPDQVIVIMPGRTDSFDVEELTVLFLTEANSIAALSSRYGITTAELRTYNHLGRADEIPSGRWLIFPTRDITPTPTPTTAPTPDLSLALTEPFGPNAEYVLHKVAQGEGTYSIEGLYLTSSAVIRAINGFEGALQPGQILVILLERRDPSGITPLSVFYVEEALQVEAVADYLGIYTADLLFYNNLQAGEIIPAGRYVIYPTPLEEE